MQRKGLIPILMALAAGTACSVAAAGPINDTCETAITITPGSVEGTTVGAGPSNNTGGCVNGSPDVYYRFVAPATCQFEIQTCDGTTDYDTILSVFTGCPQNQSNLAGCNDDACGFRSSRIVLNATRDTEYYIRVGGYQGAAGRYTLTVRQLGRPSNDTCFTAHPIGGASGAVVGDTTCAMPEGLIGCAGDVSNGSPNVYYKWTAPDHGVVTFDTCNGATQFDTFLSASTSCPHTNENVFVCNDDFCGRRSSITFGAVAGASYIIRVAGYRGDRGSFALSWAFGSNGGVPPHDECVNAQPISTGTITGTTVGAARNNPSASCLGMQRDVFYRFRPSTSMRVWINTCQDNPNRGLTVSVHNGCPASAHNRIACTLSTCDSIYFDAKTGVDYYLSVADTGGPGPFTFSVVPEVDTVMLDPSTLNEYYLMSDTYSLPQMEANAWWLGGSLASVHSHSQNQFLTNSLMRWQNVSRSVAIGLDDFGQEGTFRWVDGSPLDFNFFFDGQPDNFNGAEDFVHLMDYTGTWNDYPGTVVPSLYGAAVSSGEVAYQEINPANGHLYLLFNYSSWEGARARAQAMGGDLVTINNVAENEFVRTRMGRYGSVWIGLNDAGAEGTFQWADGSNAGFRNFPSGQPEDRWGTDDFVAMNASTGHWFDEPNIYISQSLRGVAELVLPPVVGQPVHGPRGCGTYVLVGPTNFYPALYKAQQLGGRLVSIDSAEKNEFIRATFAAPGNRRLWLGATDKDADGEFMWLDYTPFAYTNFLNGEPNNWQGNEDYLEMFSPSTGEWNDISTLDGSAGNHYAVIEIDCPCDWNADGFINSQDFFDFLNALFAGEGDFNCDGFNNSQDFFDFLTCLTAGCEA